MARMRVLLAEDNEINILYAKALFQRWNVQVDIAHDGLEALACFETQSYDVVLLDVQMPNLMATPGACGRWSVKKERLVRFSW